MSVCVYGRPLPKKFYTCEMNDINENDSLCSGMVQHYVVMSLDEIRNDSPRFEMIYLVVN